MLVVKSFVFNPFAENTYIAHCSETRQAVIIDPGCRMVHEESQLKQYIISENLKPVMLVNTHCHIDHIMGNGYVSRTWNLALHLHEGEEETMNFSSVWGKSYGLEIGDQPVERIYITDRENLKVGNETFEVLFTPGHSIAHISLYHAGQHILFSGDVLFRQGIGRYDLPGGNLEILEHSIKTRLYILPEDTKVYSGHGPVTEIGFEKEHNPYVRP
jgi:glyoxylase-like metal-dependent hydrolase (beta-lactamase superfamily II)